LVVGYRLLVVGYYLANKSQTTNNKQLKDMEALTIGVTSLIVLALGASIGSFLNVVVYRLPANLSILWPPSRCPHCLHQLGKRENIPVFGWLWLKGRCRHCRSRISVRYPLVEAIAGVLFLLVFWTYGFGVQTLGYWAFLSWLLVLSLIDLDTMTLPNALTQSGLLAGLVFQGTAGFLQTSQPSGSSDQLMSGIAGAVLGIWLFDSIGFLGSIAFGRTAMGGGDAKLAAMMGAWLGWKYLLLSGFIAVAVGAFAGGGAIALGWLDRRQPMPFGPFLALGAGLTIFCGEAIVSTYLRLFFPLS
jgi:leader peptidase (prepilin peptidase)/N-methyltransferase